MLQPTLGAIAPNPVLEEVAIGYDPQTYRLHRMFPIVPVRRRLGKFYKWDPSFWFRNLAKNRRPGARAVRGGMKATLATFEAENYAYAEEVWDEIKEEQGPAIRDEMDAAEDAMERFFETGVLGSFT